MQLTMPELYKDKKSNDPPYNLRSREMQWLPQNMFVWAAMATCIYDLEEDIKAYNLLIP